ncbi:derlin 1 [Choristoneura fumiferana]|uniref:derlin 1 n=1 Tax=Choristoneura fumiferana TaxID=7141 RepID=UPI003D15B4EA
MSEFRDWYYRVPFFTRHWLTWTIVLSLFAKFGFIDGFYLRLYLGPFISQFHIWRPITALFYYPITPNTGFHFMVNCYFLYSYSERLETGMFGGKPADYCYMLVFNWACCVLTGFLLELPILMDQMVMSVLYVWCQLNKDVVVSFWFGSRFRAMYLPWVLMIFNLIISGGGLMEFIGILVGHLAFFLLFKYPQEFGGPALLTPPSFLKQWFPDTRQMGSFGLPPESRNPVRTGHTWGRGHTLGRN